MAVEAFTLGPMHSASFKSDAKHLGFVLARYQFVARELTGFHRVLEVGCGEGTGAQIVAQVVKELHGCDIDINLLPFGPNWHKHDMVKDGPLTVGLPTWDAIYALDVLEHIAPKDQDAFFRNICGCLEEFGVFIVGSPSLESQRWASAESKKHHVNCRTEDSLRGLLRGYFRQVFMFGMNDTTLHTGFGPMCHYRLAICVVPL